MSWIRGGMMVSKVALSLAMVIATGVSVPALAEERPLRPSPPTWQTDPGCVWEWKEGGGLGLWAESCQLTTGRWDIAWNDQAAAFVLEVDGKVSQVVVQSWPFSSRDGQETLRLALIEAGQLSSGASCRFVPFAPRPAPRTMSFFILAPTDPDALKPTPTGEVPDPLCGSYGSSTHGVRYFMTDLRWPQQAIFVDEGQERPMFEPLSVRILQ